MFSCYCYFHDNVFGAESVFATILLLHFQAHPNRSRKITY